MLLHYMQVEKHIFLDARVHYTNVHSTHSFSLVKAWGHSNIFWISVALADDLSVLMNVVHSHVGTCTPSALLH